MLLYIVANTNSGALHLGMLCLFDPNKIVQSFLWTYSVDAYHSFPVEDRLPVYHQSLAAPKEINARPLGYTYDCHEFRLRPRWEAETSATLERLRPKTMCRQSLQRDSRIWSFVRPHLPEHTLRSDNAKKHRANIMIGMMRHMIKWASSWLVIGPTSITNHNRMTSRVHSLCRPGEFHTDINQSSLSPTLIKTKFYFRQSE